MRKIGNILLIVCILLIIVNCNKKYDEPPANEFPEGVLINIRDLKDEYDGNAKIINYNYIITGVITTEETNGNFYKEAFLQDNSAAIKVKLVNAGGLYIGDSIKVSVQGLTISAYGEMIQLENVDIDKNVLKIATEKTIVPYNVTINNLNMINDPCKLIQLNDVEFTDTNSTYADGNNLTTGENEITDCNGNKISLRTSGYANFSNYNLATGNGTIVGIFTKFGNEKQLLIRDINEVQLNNQRCDGTSGSGTGGGGTGGGNSDIILENDFSSNNISDNGWSQYDVGGGISWTTSDQGSTGNYYAKATNTSDQIECEAWLISPSFDLPSSLNNPILSFRNATLFENSDLEVKISTDYNGSESPINGTWIDLTYELSTGGWTWVSSGDISLSTFINSVNVYLAFVYKGTRSDYTSWEVDNVIVENQ